MREGAVYLADAVRTELLAHARDAAPRECCGLLIGVDTTIDESVRAANIDERPTRYLLDPAAHVAAIRRLRGTPRSVVGCYHSHPHSPPIPSDTDRREALYPDFVWVIVSLATPGGDLAAYRLQDEDFVPLPIVSTA